MVPHAHVTTTVPNSHKEEISGPKASFWQKVIDNELVSQRKDKTWELGRRSQASIFLTSRWVFGVKQLRNNAGKMVEYSKSRFPARSSQQVEGLEYSETLASVINITAICFLLAFVRHYDLELHQMGVFTAFLNRYLDEDIFTEQPDGCVGIEKPDLVCKWLKAIYGLNKHIASATEKPTTFSSFNFVSKLAYAISVFIFDAKAV